MKFSIYILFLTTLFLLSCSKDKEVVQPQEPPEEWEKFIGNYKVYDTIGVYLYEMDIVHFFKGNNNYEPDADSLLLKNFADTFDLKIVAGHNSVDKRRLSIGIHDPVLDKNNKSWHISGLADDPATTFEENRLLNDTIVFYFQQTNILYFGNEGQPYFFCECKHVAVKQ